MRYFIVMFTRFFWSWLLLPVFLILLTTLVVVSLAYRVEISKETKNIVKSWINYMSIGVIYHGHTYR